MPARADLRGDVGHARRLPGLRARLRPGRPGPFHGGDVRQLCPGDPLDRSANLDRAPAHPGMVAVPTGPAGNDPVHAADPLALAVFPGDLDLLRSLLRPRGLAG